MSIYKRTSTNTGYYTLYFDIVGTFQSCFESTCIVSIKKLHRFFFFQFLQMDFNKLKQIEDDLVTRTENSTTEILEKVYTKLMECVSHYKGLYDRTQLPKDLEDKMSNLLPQISTTPASTKRKVSTSSINSC